ncbi:MAG: malate dehydrogenase [Sulfurovum sp.]|nr:malate dehydrogenase [Sulfurovum sp.]MCB4752202.1 malate dehydrogenase [Sulfurovum sp.]MCB4753792.1 malate dehydrogenase [Sulfurovum sp.]MCB4754718.1 malate dehydrogenase [Sulfurovum sp.]MCB4758734.1 malate dehydrogenase [Sulfurovum sp.]
MANPKVGIIGVGAVGATAAYSLSMMGTCGEIVLFDITEGVARGKAIDIAQSAYYAPNNTIITAAETPAEISNCDIVVITAGVPRKGDMTREDLLMINAKIIKSVVKDVMKYSPDAIIICVSNPLDVMSYIIHKITGWERNRIIGLSGALDGARMAYQIYKKLGYGMGQIGTLVIGDHGENMIPLPQKVQVESINISELLSKEEMAQIIERTKNGGAEIVEHLGTSGYYGPGRAIAHMVEAILNDAKVVVSSSVLLDGEYGYRDVSVGVPIVLGKNGVEQIIEMVLDKEIVAKFKISIDGIKNSINILKKNQFFK